MSHEGSKQIEIPLAPLPRTFGEYLRSFGPGLVVVLTWLGAGDVIGAGVAGSRYGYALIWTICLALVMRFLFVSLIAKYQLCNQHGEGVLDGLARLHPWYAPFLMVTAVVMGHLYGSYMAVGIGEAWVGITGFGRTWQWAMAWTIVALALVFRPAYARVEFVFKLFLALLAVSFLGLAAWVGPDFSALAKGAVTFTLPKQEGRFDSLLVVISIIGAMGGSLMNLVYPYFLEEKGWRGPEYRRVQFYDFLLAVIVMIVLNLSVWVVGAETGYRHGEVVKDNLASLSGLLSRFLGEGGRLVFYLGFFAAVFTSIVGHAFGLATMASHGLARWQAGAGPLRADYRESTAYRATAVWVLVSPLVWTLPGMPDAMRLTLIINSLQVVLIPVIAVGLWWITASSRYIGPVYRNRWWENLVMAAVFAIALWAMRGSVESVLDEVQKLQASG